MPISTFFVSRSLFTLRLLDVAGSPACFPPLPASHSLTARTDLLRYPRSLCTVSCKSSCSSASLRLRCPLEILRRTVCGANVVVPYRFRVMRCVTDVVHCNVVEMPSHGNIEFYLERGFIVPT